jgi:Ca2+-binding RTX toxin-like protein
MELSSATVVENAADGTRVGYVSLANAKDTATYSLVGDASGCFVVDPITGEISVVNGNLLDFESASKATITVQATTSNGTVSQTFEIAIVDQNDAPDGVSLQGGTVAENVPAGTLVATVAGHDPDVGDSVTYSLSDNAGGRFVIDPNTGAIVVAIGAVLDYEQQKNYSVTVVVTDSHGETYSEAISIGIRDVAESIVREAVNGSNRSDVIGPTSGGDYTVNALRGNDQVTTGAGADIIVGGGGDDSISSGPGNDSIRFSGGSDGFDWVDGGSGYDVIEAMAKGTVIGLHSLTGVEEISANGFSGVVIKGSSIADTLDFTNVALNGIARISGGTGNDIVRGGAGNDVIFGDAGADSLAGGTGSDIFGYASGDSTVALHDMIVDFTVGLDRIDLSAIDAAATRQQRGDQAFTYIGSDAFSGVAGELRVDTSDPNVTHVYGDLNGDKIADFQIDLHGSVQLHASDFIL